MGLLYTRRDYLACLFSQVHCIAQAVKASQSITADNFTVKGRYLNISAPVAHDIAMS